MSACFPINKTEFPELTKKQVFRHKLNIVAPTETWLHDKIIDANIAITDYKKYIVKIGRIDGVKFSCI